MKPTNKHYEILSHKNMVDIHRKHERCKNVSLVSHDFIDQTTILCISLDRSPLRDGGDRVNFHYDRPG